MYLNIESSPHTYSRLFRPWDMIQCTATPAAAAAAQGTIQAPIFSQNERVIDAMNANNEPQNLTVNGDKTGIKVELIKNEDVAIDSDDEELEVVDEDDMHRMRTSECASSRSNCSQLSNGNEPFPHEQQATNRLMTESSHFPYIAAHPPSEVIYGFPQRHTMPSLHSLNIYGPLQQYRLGLLPNHVALPPIAPAPANLSRDLIYSSNVALSGINHLNPALTTHPNMGTSSGARAAAAPASAANFVGMGAYHYGAMEQEYARVMAEEAQHKAINARKQRPKKFKCPHCAVAFSNNGQLKGHIRIHTGERPFKCDFPSCGKTFTRNEELTRHKRIHTGHRPYACATCGKHFGRRDHLKKHRNTHMKTYIPQERRMGPLLMPMCAYLFGY